MNSAVKDSIFSFSREAVNLDAQELGANLLGADPAVMLLCAAHVTGDAGLLSRFTDGRTVKKDAASVAELISIITGAFASGPIEPNLLVDNPEFFQRMSEIAVDQPVAEEFLPLLLEQCGFLPSQPVVPRSGKAKSKYKVVILGAGMAGIAAGILAERNGFEYEILERAEDIGGTWRINKYPGVAVDTPSFYYSYSFRLNSEWSKYYPVGNEYNDYLRRVVDEFGIEENISFGTEVTALKWDEQNQECWPSWGGSSTQRP